MTVSGRSIEEMVGEAIAAVPDPCMHLAGYQSSIADLGLIRDVNVINGDVEVTITFTEVGCAYTHAILDMVHAALERVPGVRSVRTRIDWAPTWSPDDLLAPARVALADAKERLAKWRPIQ